MGEEHFRITVSSLSNFRLSTGEILSSYYLKEGGFHYRLEIFLWDKFTKKLHIFLYKLMGWENIPAFLLTHNSNNYSHTHIIVIVVNWLMSEASTVFLIGNSWYILNMEIPGF